MAARQREPLAALGLLALVACMFMGRPIIIRVRAKNQICLLYRSFHALTFDLS